MGCYSHPMVTHPTHEVLSPLEQEPARWTDHQINQHPLVELGWAEIPPDQIEEARLVQLEQLRRFRTAGTLPYYAEDAEDLELLIEITTDPERFARVCAGWRRASNKPPTPIELPGGRETFQEAGHSWFVGDEWQLGAPTTITYPARPPEPERPAGVGK